MKAGTSNRYRESASTINRQLSNMESVLSELLARFELDGVSPSPAELKEAFGLKMGRSVKKTEESINLDQAIAMYLSEPSLNLTSATVRGYITAQNRFRESGLADLSLTEITESDLSNFISELWAEGLENQTAQLYVSKISTILRYAKSKGLYNGTLHDTFKPKFKGLMKKDLYYLEWSEFESMLYLQFTSPIRTAVRDAFCFCCATGLRVSDCSELRWSNVHLDCDVPHISLIAKKTTKPTVIELNNYARALIDRQLPNAALPDGYVFPPVKFRTRNFELPLIAKAAGIQGKVRKLSFIGNKVTAEMVDKADAISTHWGRHTFIVHALSLGISPTIVMQWTGHASFESLKPYIAICDQAKKSSMDLFNN